MAVILEFCRQQKARGDFLLFVKKYPRLPTLITQVRVTVSCCGAGRTQMAVSFSKSGCQEVSDALVIAAKGMSGFDSCSGGNK